MLRTKNACWISSYILFLIMLVRGISELPPSAVVLNDTDLLKNLRDSLVDEREIIPSWFDSETSPCKWAGIKCDGLVVSHIALPCTTKSPHNLRLPRKIGEFRSLKYLNLSHCAFIGEIYQEFWDLVNLEVLDLSDNRLTGVLPPSIAQLKYLRQLVLDDNGFSGMLPSTIGKLTAFKELSLHSNSFSGNLPKQLGNLQEMQSLDISNNIFSGNLPSSLSNLTRLLYFSARQNKFSGRLFADIGRLQTLRILDLSWNFLTGTIPSSIGNLTNLEVLDLQNCRFKGNVPAEISMLSHLNYLNLGQNTFDGGLPACIGRLVNLVYLIAPNSGLSGTIPSGLGNCKNLKIINLSFNSLSGHLPTDLVGLESISSLLLDSNHLSGTVPEWISEWRQAESIVLSQNLFTGNLPPLNLPSLTLLDVSSNKLFGEISSDICNARSLATLSLSGNKFSGNMDDAFSACYSLTDLILSDNEISGEIPAYFGKLGLIILELTKNKLHGRIPDELWESKTLMEISLSNNLLKGTISSAVSNVLTLERLQLDNNLFEGSIPSSIGKLKNLTNLSLHGNKLTGSVPSEVFECSKLVSLDLGANELTGEIPKSISELKLLDNLVLSDNQFSGFIPEEICSGFQRVPLPDSEFVQHYGMLDLSYNDLEGPIPESIRNCIVMTELLLQGNKLNGSIPKGLASLVNLTLLDLSFNYFSGLLDFQLLTTNLQGIVLSHNNIRGSIPDHIRLTMPNLAKLDLSNNELTGTLPASLFRIKTLSYLDVSSNTLSGSLSFNLESISSLLLLNASNNKFSGFLDDSISNLTSLSVLDLHNNRFTGRLPVSLATLVALTYLDISENSFRNAFPCQICNIEGLTFSNFSSNSFSMSFPASCAEAKSCFVGLPMLPSGRTYSSSSIGYRSSLFAAAIGATIIFSIILYGLLRWKMLRKYRTVVVGSNAKTESASNEGLLGKKMKEPLSINVATFEYSLLRLKAADILSATENFSRSYIIGDGGFGTVYRARLPDGQTIAVKRLNGGHLHGEREFLAEMETIGKVKHDNLLSLLGYCVFADERFLIYEYMENGSLDFWLRNQADAFEGLDWPTRFQIALGSARGLSFLHHGFVPHIIHRDIKSSNILLDKNFEPRVSDFGLARIISACESHVSTVLAGTFGYIPPEYGQKMVATTKGDVYSFGVVMLELVTGQAPIGQADVEGGNLVGWVRWMVEKGRECDILDPFLSRFPSWKDQMLHVLDVARSCTCDEPWMRPTMMEVVKLLKKAKMEDGCC
ncbi:leucine-rich repeat receptor protein kinase EXS-like [Dorcoceras hygrometricum]|uniref:non-specific serine/threonine protein kinase n=1 Tax=Dorcoceras hygrometricum TaxID=472368 RepID=A0A2Z7BDJ1_9LAMI|nr:leucine-rich repeat receptor protein kinase EXS-like [Dorcoceras hygrometricum]